jgi:hypothetical protein
MIILGKYRTTGNLVIYPAEEALNKQVSKKIFAIPSSPHHTG